MQFRSLLALLAAALLVACNPAAVINNSKAELEEFRSAWARGDAEDIWTYADPDFREAVTRNQLDAMVTDFGVIFGPFQSSEQESFVIGSAGGRANATIKTLSQYANGEVLETFIFQENGDAMMLLNYEAQSTLLDDYDWSKLTAESDGVSYTPPPGG